MLITEAEKRLKQMETEGIWPEEDTQVAGKYNWITHLYMFLGLKKEDQEPFLRKQEEIMRENNRNRKPGIYRNIK